MNCIFCQNYEISQLGKGKEITIEGLADIMIKQQEKGVENINLVTPTSYALHIIEAIKIARKNGLYIPIVYNTNGYESVETLKMLEGYIDIYLPDLKYFYDELGKEYSKVNNYFEVATKAIKEMYRQVGTPQLDDNGIMKKGLMIRHLILPNQVENSKQVLKWIKENIDNNVFVSIMAQYFPTYKAKEIEGLNRKLTKEEYEEVENYLYDLDLENGYIQELGEHEEEYVPKWEI
jgi:putative pyruvate formate lyase activating enzyme